MPDRSIVVKLRAEVNGFKAAMAEASKASEKMGRDAERSAQAADTALGKMVQSARANSAEWTTAGATLTGFGAAALGALGLATKAAMDWESSWAGVAKTVDGTAPQMAALEAGLRGLARELPASHQEIAAVAEAAGQLGVAQDDIISFTRTMINLGETTNLSADEASTAIAQFANVMQTSSDDVDNLGSALVALGNNGASTERDILLMAQRISGAGQIAGASEQDVLALSSALASVGVEAEAGGSSMSRVLAKINTDVLAGGDALAQWADVAGVSAEEFSAAWRESPVKAMDMFLTGLNGVTESGGNAVAVLSDLGIKSTEETRSLLSLAGAGDLLSESLTTSNSAWERNVALTEEAAKRYQTTEAQLALARNAIVDAGITIGGQLLPALAQVANGVADVVTWFGDLPGPVHTAVAAFGGLGGAASLAAGSFLLIFPRVVETVDAFKTLQSTAPGAARGVSTLGRTAAIAAAGVTSLAIAFTAVEPMLSSGSESSLNDFADALERIGSTDTVGGVRQLDSMFTANDWFSGLNVNGLRDAHQIITDPSFAQSADNVVSRLVSFGQRGSSDMEFVNREWATLDQTLAGMASSGNLDEFQGTLEAIASELGVTVDELLRDLPATDSALVALSNTAGVAGGAMGEFGDATGEATGAAEEQVDVLGELQEMLQGTADLLLGSRDAARQWEQALDDAQAAIEANGATLDITTEKGRENQAALDGIASSTHELAAQQEELGASAAELDGIMAEGRTRFIDSAVAMGMSRDEASALADELQLIPGQYEAEVIVSGVDAAAEMARAGIEAVTADPFTATVDADTSEAVQQTYGFREVVENTNGTIQIDADTYYAEATLAAFDQTVASHGGEVTINGNKVPAEEALAILETAINNGDGTVTINGNTYQADDALIGLIGEINSSGGTTTIDANTTPARVGINLAVAAANSAVGIIDVDANTGAAESGINHTARGREADITAEASTGDAAAELGRVARDRTATIYVRTVASAAASAIRAGLGYATGGAVYGPGTATSDSIPAMLSNGEHVFTAREVAMAGGQDAVYRLRERIRLGGLRFADGGGVERGGYAPAPVSFSPAPRAGAGTMKLDTSSIGPAVREALSEWKPVVEIGGRKFAGVMMDTSRRIHAFGGRL